MRWRVAFLFFSLCLSNAWSQTKEQAQESDIVQALRQQREEALDKVANAYVVIMKLQRELDRLKADPKPLDAPHPK
jgi:hypothetical protein